MHRDAEADHRVVEADRLRRRGGADEPAGGGGGGAVETRDGAESGVARGDV